MSIDKRAAYTAQLIAHIIEQTERRNQQYPFKDVEQFIKEGMQKARNDAIEECASTMCEKCKNGLPVEKDGCTDFWHSLKDEESFIYHCPSSKILALKTTE